MFFYLIKKKRIKGVQIQLSGGIVWDLIDINNNKIPPPIIIARSLGNICRFAGNTSIFYSVAEHSVKCSYLVEPQYSLEALLHDAHECIINDIPSPVKRRIDYSSNLSLTHLERYIESNFRKFYNVPEILSSQVKIADLLILKLEIDCLFEENKLFNFPKKFMENHKKDYDLVNNKILNYRNKFVPEGWEPTFKNNVLGKGAEKWLQRFEELTK